MGSTHAGASACTPAHAVAAGAGVGRAGVVEADGVEEVEDWNLPIGAGWGPRLARAQAAQAAA